MKPKQKEIEKAVQEALSWISTAIRLAKQMVAVETVNGLRDVAAHLGTVLDQIEDRHDAEDRLRREPDREPDREPEPEPDPSVH
jgi:hypothetical protein